MVEKSSRTRKLAEAAASRAWTREIRIYLQLVEPTSPEHLLADGFLHLVCKLLVCAQKGEAVSFSIFARTKFGLHARPVRFFWSTMYMCLRPCRQSALECACRLRRCIRIQASMVNHGSNGMQVHNEQIQSMRNILLIGTLRYDYLRPLRARPPYKEFSYTYCQNCVCCGCMKMLPHAAPAVDSRPPRVELSQSATACRTMDDA